MLHSRERTPSDTESVSSEISDVTSRATTIPDCWSNAGFQQQGTNRSNQLNIQSIDDGRFSTASGTTNTSIETVINKKPEILGTNTNQFTSASPQNSNQQQGWVNPYWGANPKSTTAVTPPGNNKINNSGQSSSATPAQQLIPGSILINDRGEIDDRPLKKNARLDSITSNNSFHPGGKYVSDENGGPGGYLAPTHIQRRTVISSPEDNSGYKQPSSLSSSNTGIQPKFNQQQTFPESTNNDTQPWVNPYWSSKPNQENSQLTKKDTTIPDQKLTSSTESSKNPYWKDDKAQTSTGAKQQDKTWENPYWKNDKAQASTTPEKWENPYWKGDKTQTSTTTPKQQDKPWENPYWKDDKSQAATTAKQQDKKLSNQGTGDTVADALSSDYKIIPVPSFYERIYPAQTPSSSPATNANTKPDTIPSNTIPKQNGHDDDALPYTIDNNGIARYRTSSPPSVGTNKAATFASPPTTSQHPILPPHNVSAAPPPKTTNNALPQSTNLNAYSSSSFNYHASSITSSSAVFTEEDLNNIQNALRLLETNPNGIPTIEASDQVPSFNVSSGNNVSSPFASLFTNNSQHQSQQQPPFSSFSQNKQFNSPPNTSNSNPQQNSLLSLFSPNQQFNSPPTTYNSNPPQNSLLSLFSQNQQFSSPPNSSNPNNEFNLSSYISNSNSQQPPLFSSPSYPSNNLNEPLHPFSNLGPIILI